MQANAQHGEDQGGARNGSESGDRAAHPWEQGEAADNTDEEKSDGRRAATFRVPAAAPLRLCGFGALCLNTALCAATLHLCAPTHLRLHASAPWRLRASTPLRCYLRLFSICEVTPSARPSVPPPASVRVSHEHTHTHDGLHTSVEATAAWRVRPQWWARATSAHAPATSHRGRATRPAAGAAMSGGRGGCVGMRAQHRTPDPPSPSCGLGNSARQGGC